jgi:hypothetical protein
VNPIVVLRSIKAFIREYEDDLLEDLESGGIQKVIGQITTSRSTLARMPIFIAIAMMQGDEYYDSTEIGNAISYDYVVTQQARVRYDVTLHVGDYLQPQSGEEIGTEYEPYEKDTETFWTFVARLVRLFREHTAIPASSGDFTIEVYGDGSEQDRRIGVRDLSGRVPDASGQLREALYAVLDFGVGTCDEPNPLA